MKIVYTPQAREDLREIRNYIKDVLKNPTAAKNITDKIINHAHLLSNQPKLGVSLVSKIDRETDYRYLLSGNHGIFYLISDDRILITRILDLRTDYMRIIFAD